MAINAAITAKNRLSCISGGMVVFPSPEHHSDKGYRYQDFRNSPGSLAMFAAIPFLIYINLRNQMSWFTGSSRGKLERSNDEVDRGCFCFGVGVVGSSYATHTPPAAG